jgi:Arm DNA-binding domain
MLSMPKVMLTDRFAAGAKPLNGDERTDFFDALVTGLCLRATKDRRSWSFCFTNPSDKKWTRLTLGTYPAISLAAAWQSAGSQESSRSRTRPARVIVGGGEYDRRRTCGVLSW